MAASSGEDWTTTSSSDNDSARPHPSPKSEWPGPFRLFDLPEELIIAIVSFLPDTPTRRSLARTCARLQSLAEPALYNNIFLRTDLGLENVARALGRGYAHRVESVRRLEVRCRYGHVRREDLRYLGGVLREVGSGLRELCFESPFCNKGRWRRGEAGGWGRMFGVLGSWMKGAVGGGEVLGGLRKLTLHLNGLDGREFWDVSQDWACIFNHQSLEEVWISSANVDVHTLSGIDTKMIGKTPLKSLTLDECNVDQPGLRAVMMMPKALERFSLGEAQNCQDELGDRFSEFLTRDLTKFFDSLSKQANSLQYLYYIPPSAEFVRMPAQSATPGLSFTNFTSLTELVLDGRRTYLHNILASDLTAPPNLKKLTVSANVAFWQPERVALSAFSTEWTANMLSALRGLDELRVDFDGIRSYVLDRRQRGVQTVPTELHQMMKDIGDVCKKQKTTLTAYTRAHRTFFVAPILYGERVPEPELVFDGAKSGWLVPKFEDGVAEDDDIDLDDTSEEDGEDDDDDDDDDDYDDDEDYNEMAEEEEFWAAQHGIPSDVDLDGLEEEVLAAAAEGVDLWELGQNDDWFEQHG